MAGLTVARQLHTRATVTVLEKSRGVGGRLATRHQPPWAFDHGAQYFTARDPRFQARLQPWLDAGAVVDWHPRVTTLARGAKPYKRDWFEPHYVPHGAMNSLGRLLAEDVDVRLETRIDALHRDGHDWWLEREGEPALGPFDWVVVAVPVPQARALLPRDFSGAAALPDVDMVACFTLMLGLAADPDWTFDCAVIKDEVLGWLALNHRKPGRSSAPALVVHSHNDWAQAHVETDSTTVRAAMLTALRDVLPSDLPEIIHQDLHRWRYADVRRPLDLPFLMDASLQLAVCGDGCLGGRVEAAFLSGLQLAEALVEAL